MPFNVPFEIADYKCIIPDLPTHETEVINYQHFGRGDIDKCVWKRQVPDIITEEYRSQEANRVLRDGVWIFIKDELVWLPPNYYFGLQYGRAGSDEVEFRVKRLKHVYFKIMARHNKYCMGTLTMKNRGDGETTMAVIDAMWECLYGNMTVGQIGIQSKTRDDAQNPCWNYVQNLWQNFPLWLKKDLYDDFISGTNIAEKMQWQSNANESEGITGRNVLFKYYPSVANAMDGKHNMKRCILDEICKWNEAKFAPTFTNYKKFIMPGLGRRGLFDMFSSPADFECVSNDQVKKLWEKSDTTNLDPQTGTTISQIHRHYSNPLEGIQDGYDRWGDADANQIYESIMRQRKSVEPEDYLAEVRGYPLNQTEMFESAEDGKTWDNYEGVKKRAIYLLGTRFKNENTKEPVGVYGNLEWKDGVEDSDVVFRGSNKSKFDVHEARFFVAFQPQNRQELRDIYKPPSYIEDVLGIDPFDNRHTKTQTPSKGAAINFKFRDLHDSGLYRVPTLAYLARPHHERIFYEDMIRAAIYNRSMVQYENINAGIARHFEDRGYHAWLLPSKGEKLGSMLTGDAPRGGGRGAFMDEVLGLLNAFLNLPPDDKSPYYLDNVWIRELLEDLLSFNVRDTHVSDLSMAFGQSLYGAAKMLHKKPRAKSELNGAVMSWLFD